MTPIAALLFATAVSQVPPPEAILQDGFDAGAACPSTIPTDTGNLTLRRISDIWYLPNVHVRHGVDVTTWDNIWGHINELDDVTLWPGVPGTSPTIKTVGRSEYVAARFHVPALVPPMLGGMFKHVMYGGGPAIDVTISQTCGDFRTLEPGCWVRDWPSNDVPSLRWHIGAGNASFCHVEPNTDYFLNIRFSNPNTTGPDCTGNGCQITLQQYIGAF
jgi:hypothetical protein